MSSGGELPLWRLVSKRARAIVPLAGHGKECPLYCIHSITGEVTSLRPLAQMIGSERPVYGIQVPAEKLGSSFAMSVEGMAEYYVEKLTIFQPEGPLLLGGWSAGAVIALAMAQILQQRGRTVRLLVVFDGVLYNTGAGISPWNPLYYWELSRNLPRWIADHLSEDWGIRSIAERIVRILKMAMALIIAPVLKVQPQWAVDALLNTSRLPPDQAAFARSLLEALRRYQPKPYNGRVIVYAARTRPLFRLWQVKATWAKIAADIEAVSVDAGHSSLLQGPQVAVLATHLRERFATLGFVPVRSVQAEAPGPNALLELSLHPSTPT